MPVSTMGVGVNQKTGEIERYQPPGVVPEASGATINPAPPANPRPGTMWWDGSVFSIWDGSAWQAVTGGGSLTLPLSVAQGGTGVTSVGAAPFLPLTGGTLVGNLTAELAVRFSNVILRDPVGGTEEWSLQADGTGLLLFRDNTSNPVATLSQTGGMTLSGILGAQGLRVQSQPVTFGPPDSGGTGFRQLVVPN